MSEVPTAQLLDLTVFLPYRVQFTRATVPKGITDAHRPRALSLFKCGWRRRLSLYEKGASHILCGGFGL